MSCALIPGAPFTIVCPATVAMQETPGSVRPMLRVVVGDGVESCEELGVTELVLAWDAVAC